MAENIDNAFQTIEKRGKEQLNLSLPYPMMVDAPSALVGGAAQTPGQIQDAWDVQAGGQFSCDSRVAKMYRLNRYGPVSFVLIDRQHRIRAIATSPAAIQGAPDSRFAELVEYLLLNVGGVEAIPYDVRGMSDADLRQSVDGANANGLYSWEHAAELQRRETQQGSSQLSALYPLFGQEAPDFELPLINGTGSATFSSLSKDKVTLLVLFWAGGDQSDFTATSQATAAMEMLRAVERLHVDWTLKLAEPGAEEYADAQPFKATNTDIAKASTRGALPQPTVALEPEQQEATEAEGEEGEGALKTKRWGVSLALGARHYSWKDEFGRQGLSQWNLGGGIKLGVQIWEFLAAEASVLPSFILQSFKEDADHYDARRQVIVPLSINVMVKPSLGEGRFWPFITLGLGPSFASFRKRVDRHPTGYFPTQTNPYCTEYYYPSGIGFMRDAGVGAEFNINEKIFIGLDIRYFFLTISQDAFDPDAIRDESDAFAINEPVVKDYQYDNASVFAYVGLKF